MLCRSVPLYPDMCQELAELKPGTVLQLETACPRALFVPRAMRITTQPAARRMNSQYLDGRTSNPGGWVDAHFVQAQMLYNHSVAPSYNWQTYPTFWVGRAPVPVVVAYHLNRENQTRSCALMWWGSHGQPPTEFLRQVTAGWADEPAGANTPTV
jgi:hypothetical protein